MIKLSNVYKRFDHQPNYVVNDISFEITDGKILVILGSSGSGKTTLLKMLNRLIKPTQGQIEIDGQDIFDIDPITLRHSMGYVFQGVGLFPHMTVAENICIVLKLSGVPLKQREQRAAELLDLVKLTPHTFAQRYPDELSGGQQQRVGVARALANDPKYLLMDEPFGAVDFITRSELQTEILHLNQKLKKTIVFITHDVFEALQLGDLVAFMHQGRIQQLGCKQTILQQPANQFVKDIFVKPLQQYQQLDWG